MRQICADHAPPSALECSLWNLLQSMYHHLLYPGTLWQSSTVLHINLNHIILRPWKPNVLFGAMYQMLQPTTVTGSTISDITSIGGRGFQPVELILAGKYLISPTQFHLLLSDSGSIPPHHIIFACSVIIGNIVEQRAIVYVRHQKVHNPKELTMDICKYITGKTNAV